LRTEEEKDRVDRRLLKRQEQRKQKLKEAGVDYDFDMVAYVRWCFSCFAHSLTSVAEKETTDE
jgi:nucleolar protein 15